MKVVESIVRREEYDDDEGGWVGRVNCLREGFENFSRFNKILYVNPKQESS